MRSYALLALALLCMFCADAFAGPDPEEAAKQFMDAGGVLFKKKKFSDAILEYQKALEIVPEAAGPHRELGKCYEKIKKYDEAIDHYTEYLRRRPKAKERDEIVKNLPLLRKQISHGDRALVSVKTNPPEALIYALTEKGEERAIGISPITAHPLETRFTKLRLYLPSGTSVVRELQLESAKSVEFTFDIVETPLTPATAPVVAEPIKPVVTEPVKPVVVETAPVVLAEAATTPSHADTPKEGHLRYAVFGLAGASTLAAVLTGASLALTTNRIGDALVTLTETPNNAQDTQTAELEALQQKQRSQLIATDAALATSSLSGGATLYLLVKSARHGEETAKKALVGITGASFVAAAASGGLFWAKDVALRAALDSLPTLSTPELLTGRARAQSLDSQARFWASASDAALVALVASGAATTLTLLNKEATVTLSPNGASVALSF